MKNNNCSFEFSVTTLEQVHNLISIRAGETKIGEKIHLGKACLNEKCNYVIIGISEDIGPQSNGGFAGSTTAFDAFLPRFLNLQANEFIPTENIGIYGEIHSLVAFSNLDQGRNLVAELDDFVIEILKPIVEMGKIPIVIGGGHNNAYPLIKSCSSALSKAIQVVNCDPHADFRPLEGRHSGNSFSYAYNEGFLVNYTVLGLHQSYNSHYILEALKTSNSTFTFWDEYLSGNRSFENDLKDLASKLQNFPVGIELDMDAIAYMPSSAFTPSGLSVEQARKYVLQMAKSKQAVYLHLPEAAPKNSEEEKVVGKTLAYLVSDFIKSHATTHTCE